METAGSFNQFIFDAIQQYWDQDAMSDYGVSTLQYKDGYDRIYTFSHVN